MRSVCRRICRRGTCRRSKPNIRNQSAKRYPVLSLKAAIWQTCGVIPLLTLYRKVTGMKYGDLLPWRLRVAAESWVTVYPQRARIFLMLSARASQSHRCVGSSPASIQRSESCARYSEETTNRCRRVHPSILARLLLSERPRCCLSWCMAAPAPMICALPVRATGPRRPLFAQQTSHGPPGDHVRQLHDESHSMKARRLR